MPVFLSHCRSDIDPVNRIAMTLVSANIKVWKDEWKIPSGSSITDEIRSAITDSEVFVVAISSAAQQSKWVADEIAWCLQQTKRPLIIPLSLDGTNPPASISDHLAIDFSADFDRGLRNLTQRLENYERTVLRVEIGERYFLDYDFGAYQVNEALILEIDTISSDREEDHTVLAQLSIRVLGEQMVKLGVEADAKFIHLLLTTLHKEVLESRPIIKLNGGDVYRERVNITIEGMAVPVTLRIRRMGNFSAGFQVFNLGDTIKRVVEHDSSKSEEAEGELDLEP